MKDSYIGVKKIMDIIKISGFFITSEGDPTVGISDAVWNLEEDFYFDNQQELEIFRNELKKLFENYCGIVKVETFEEYQKLITDEEQDMYAQYPTRYLIKDKESSDLYKQADCCASYSSNVGEAIHFELPNYIPEEGDSEHEVIKSSDPEFKKILLDAAGDLERRISNDEYRLNIARRNLALIEKELKYGK